MSIPAAPAATPSPSSAPASTHPAVRLLRRTWPLIPLALALLYVAVYGFLARRPSLEAMVPDDAFVTWRYRDLAAYDAAHATLLDDKPAAPQSAVLGAELNVPGLPGVSRERPLLEAWLKPEGRVDVSYFVLPVDDASALMRKFRDPDLKERHARHVRVHGDWAAAGWDQREVLHAGFGSGTMPPDDAKALWSVTADWPRLVDFALQPTVASEEPWSGLLAGLGFRPASAKAVEDAPDPTVAVEAGRVPLVRDAWRRVSVTAFSDRVVATLEPSSTSDLGPVLAAIARGEGGATRPEVFVAPADAEAWIRTPGGEARRALALALAYAGVRWPEAVAKDRFAAVAGAGPLLAAATPTPSAVPGWTILLAGTPTAVPDLAGFGLPPLPAEGRADLPPNAGPLLAPYGGEAARGEVASRAVRLGSDGDSIVAIGAGAEGLVGRFSAEARRVPMEPVIADAFLAKFPAQRLLGRALRPGGFLATVAESDLAITLRTDGTRLIVEIQRAASGSH
jgi:hypothetical protein